MYLARGLSEAAAPEGFLREGEEAHMDIVWAALDDLVSAVLAGRVQNPTWSRRARHMGGAASRTGTRAYGPPTRPGRLGTCSRSTGR